MGHITWQFTTTSELILNKGVHEASWHPIEIAPSLLKPRLSLIKLSGSKNVTQREDKRNENYTLSPIKIATSQIQLHLHRSEISLQHFDQKDLFLKDRVKHQILKNFVKKRWKNKKSTYNTSWGQETLSLGKWDFAQSSKQFVKVHWYFFVWVSWYFVRKIVHKAR